MAKKKNFIQKAIKKPGALRAQLGVKEGSTIPKSTLNKIANAKVGDTVAGRKVTAQLKRRAVLARTMSKFKKK